MTPEKKPWEDSPNCAHCEAGPVVLVTLGARHYRCAACGLIALLAGKDKARCDMAEVAWDAETARQLAATLDRREGERKEPLLREVAARRKEMIKK